MDFRDRSEFPTFKDGDVYIAITAGQTYQLHAVVLRCSSKTLARLLTESRAADPSPKNKADGNAVRYWLELDQTGMFKLKEINNRTRNGGAIRLPDVDNGRESKELHGQYDRLFRAFYHIRPNFDDRSISAVLYDSMGLIELADAVGSIEAISETVDIALMRQGDILFKSIAANPATWSDLALRISSPTIFKEAIVHLVGQWQSMASREKPKLPAVVLELCQKKFAELQVKKKAVEIGILSHYPAALMRAPDSRPSRASYGADIYLWMSLNLVRHWFGQALSEGRGRTAKDGGAGLYRQIGAGGYSYLDRDTMERFHRHFPMTQRAIVRLEEVLSEVKQEIKAFVKDLLVNNTRLDIKKEDTPYLTCCEVKKEDLPWEEKNTAGEQGSLRGRLLETVAREEEKDDERTSDPA
ncbi:MAG: hypothetical protein M1816_006606 [Peltula sp. TS41687]|nr:MAG: hypothetical protein M1816_006606 [Peltula sp. TS41687]